MNLGHVGFLAEAEPDGLTQTVDHLLAGDYRVEERMTLDVVARDNGTQIASTWALNEVTVEKAARERMVEVVIEVDGRPLSRWGCDGVVCATPTGSTAYAFSAGGPWSGPRWRRCSWCRSRRTRCSPGRWSSRRGRCWPWSSSARAASRPRRGARPRRGRRAGGLESERAVLWCDGRRRFDLPPGARIEVRRGELPVLLARVHDLGGAPAGGEFTDRLVAKFDLPGRRLARPPGRSGR